MDSAGERRGDSSTRNAGGSGPTSPVEATPLPPASVLIPTRNRPTLLREMVQSVVAGEEVPLEVIVVDQSDAPDAAIASLGIIRGCEVRYLWEPGAGVSRARNAAMRAASADIFVFADDDVLVERTWFGALVRALLHAGPRVVVTGRVLPEAGAMPGWFAPSLRTDDSDQIYEGRVGRDVLFSANMAMLRSTADEIGSFDERLRRAQDNDYGYRLLEAGYRIKYVPEAALVHRAARTAAQYLPLRWRYGVGQGRFYAKHFDLHDRYMAKRMVTDVAQRLRSIPSLLLSEPRRALGNATFMVGVLAGAAGWLVPPIRGSADTTGGAARAARPSPELSRGSHRGA